MCCQQAFVLQTGHARLPDSHFGVWTQPEEEKNKHDSMQAYTNTSTHEDSTAPQDTTSDASNVGQNPVCYQASTASLHSISSRVMAYCTNVTMHPRIDISYLAIRLQPDTHPIPCPHSACEICGGTPEGTRQSNRAACQSGREGGRKRERRKAIDCGTLRLASGILCVSQQSHTNVVREPNQQG